MKTSILAAGALFLLSASSSPAQVGFAVERTVLPIAEPTYPAITTFDARNRENPSCAQNAGSLGRPQFFVTPYLWLAGVYATTATPLQRAPEVNSSVGSF